MKKIIPSTLLIIVITLLFSINGRAQGITITKRHYTKGFYVDFGGKKKIVCKAMARQTEKQSIVSAETNTIITIPTAKDNAPEQMPLVAVNNVSVKRENTRRHVTANTKIAEMQAKVATNKSETKGITSSSVNNTNNRVSISTSNNSGINLLLLIIITILLPPLGVALVKGIGLEFWLDLILTLLFYVPGLIYGLIVVLS
jgi:uncharacterized membrane protein YqaE (UPF0057 family)